MTPHAHTFRCRSDFSRDPRTHPPAKALLDGAVAHYSEFRYGPDRARFAQEAMAGGVLTETVYVGGLYERIERDGVVERGSGHAQ